MWKGLQALIEQFFPPVEQQDQPIVSPVPTKSPIRIIHSTPTPTPTKGENPRRIMQYAQANQSQPPTPTPTIIPQFQDVNPETQRLILKYFGGDNNAVNVAAKESSLNPSLIQEAGNAYIPELGRKSRDYGLFQVNDWWQRENLKKAGYTIEDMLDAEKNIQFAKWLYDQNGWEPWHGARSLGL